MDTQIIWDSKDLDVWEKALATALNDNGRDFNIETKLSNLNIDYISNMNVEEFYTFLYDHYFVWKYTAKNRLKTTRNSLEKYRNNQMDELQQIKSKLFSFELTDTELGLYYATKIYGLGVAGASGLLALLYPSYFGTVDDMVVRALEKTEEYANDKIIKKMNKQSLKIQDGVYLINIYKKKSAELNNLFGSYNWKPRDIDVILWYFR